MNARSPRILGAAAVVALAACARTDTITSPYGNVADVYASGAIYTPPSADISLGGTVRFHMTATAAGEGHNAIFSRATPGAPDDINIVVNETVSRTFSVRGTFAYACTVHPGMGGEVVVH